MRFPVSPPDPTEALSYQARQQRFSLGMASLSATEQTLFHLRYYQEVPLNDLANRYGLTYAAVNRRLRRIHTKLEQTYARQLPG